MKPESSKKVDSWINSTITSSGFAVGLANGCNIVDSTTEAEARAEAATFCKSAKYS